MAEDASLVSVTRGRAIYLIYRGLGVGMQRLPESLAGASATVVAQALVGFRRDARTMYARHLARVFGRPLSQREARAWAKRAFRNYARYWFEGARLPDVPSQVVLDRLTVESGYEYLVEHMAAGRGVVMALPHVGTWEWGGAWLALKGYPMTTVAELVEPRALYDWFVAQREAMGLSIVPMEPGVGGTLLR
ncbi:MAG: hypothetical protein ABSH04_08265, partial [Acidimicrobiales bacterium]